MAPLDAVPSPLCCVMTIADAVAISMAGFLYIVLAWASCPVVPSQLHA